MAVQVAWRAGGVQQRAARFTGVYDVRALLGYAGAEVRVHLADGMAWSGRLRTDLLTERSLSVYICDSAGQGATLYIDSIAEIVLIAEK